MELVKKHIITILCVLALIMLALPFASVECEVEIMGASGSSSTTMTGFNALKNSFFAYILIAGPVFLVAMNYIKPLERHKGLFAILVPVICLISLIIVVIRAKSFSTAASGGDMVSAEVKLKVGIGAILAGLTYIGTAISGAVIYHDFTFNKEGIEKLKNSAGEMINAAQEKVSDLTQTVQEKAGNISLEMPQKTTAGNVDGTTPAQKPAVKKSTNLNRVDEILSLIEKLAKMKDAGALTEEEFTEKKKQLLEEIQ